MRIVPLAVLEICDDSQVVAKFEGAQLVCFAMQNKGKVGPPAREMERQDQKSNIGIGSGRV